MTTIGVIGAGKLGTVVAQLAVAAGYRTLIAASGDPRAIELIVDVLSPGAIAMRSDEVVRDADLVVLAIPISKLGTLPTAEFAGKSVIDATNYWPPTDGVIDRFEEAPSSPIVADALPGAHLVKALSHLGYHDLAENGRPRGDADRHAIAIAGDDVAAVTMVADFVDRIGFDPVVVAGGLEAGAAFGPGSDIFGVSTDRATLHSLLGDRDAVA